MADKDHQTYDAELRKMSAYDVRENSEPSVQPDPIKRAMAVTELERRRQARAPSTIKDPITGRAVGMIVLGAVIAAAVFWGFF